MTTFPKGLTLAAAGAALALGFCATPASAFDSPYDDQRMALSNPGWVNYDQDPYARPAPYGYGGPTYGVSSGAIAVCPQGYHLGRSGALCWPN